MARPSIQRVFKNLAEYDAGLLTKVRMTITNNITKVRTRSQCCGHPGQPGC